MTPDEIVKLASNESPDGPFPGVVEAATMALAQSNRYPDDDLRALTAALSAYLDIPGENFWFGNGSVGLLTHIALATGGPGKSAVYGWPSFVMYRIASRWAMTEPIEVPLDEGHVLDLDAMTERYVMTRRRLPVQPQQSDRDDCLVGDDDGLHRFRAGIDPDRDRRGLSRFVTDESYATAIPDALRRPNVLVLRTFSKIFALAAHRVGYAVGQPGTIRELRKAQPPFTVTQVAQVAAAASLGNNGASWSVGPGENPAARHQLLGVLAERSLPHTKSRGEFRLFRAGDAGRRGRRALHEARRHRPPDGRWLAEGDHRGQHENRRFVEALDDILNGI